MVSLSLLLRQSAASRSLPHGLELHHCIVCARLDPLLVLANCLVHMYARCGSTPDAVSVFDRMDRRNVFSWSILIKCLSEEENGISPDEAYLRFRQMMQEGTIPNQIKGCVCAFRGYVFAECGYMECFTWSVSAM